MSEWQTEEQRKAAKSISSAFGGPTSEQPEDEESLWSKVKRYLVSQFQGPSFGEKVSEQLKKTQGNELTTPKK